MVQQGVAAWSGSKKRKLSAISSGFSYRPEVVQATGSAGIIQLLIQQNPELQIELDHLKRQVLKDAEEHQKLVHEHYVLNVEFSKMKEKAYKIDKLGEAEEMYLEKRIHELREELEDKKAILKDTGYWLELSRGEERTMRLENVGLDMKVAEMQKAFDDYDWDHEECHEYCHYSEDCDIKIMALENELAIAKSLVPVDDVHLTMARIEDAQEGMHLIYKPVDPISYQDVNLFLSNDQSTRMQTRQKLLHIQKLWQKMIRFHEMMPGMPELEAYDDTMFDALLIHYNALWEYKQFHDMLRADAERLGVLDGVVQIPEVIYVGSQ